MINYRHNYNPVANYRIFYYIFKINILTFIYVLNIIEIDNYLCYIINRGENSGELLP